MKTYTGHFDGQVVVLDEPSNLRPNTKVQVLAVDDAESEAGLSAAFSRASEQAFAKIWDNSLDADYDRL